MKQHATNERLHEVLHYAPQTGVFTWRQKRGRQSAGSVAGSATGSGGYRRLMIDGSLFLAHRLAVQYVTGAIPIDDVDHRNGVVDDNRYDNLRNATRSVNNQNRHRESSKNSTGYLGVTFDRRDGRYYASIFVDGRKRGLGGYTTPRAAHTAYVEAKRELHAGCTL